VKQYVLDTNLYVHAYRSAKGADELEKYLREFTPSTYLSSIVLHELLVGASTEAKAREIQEHLLGPLIRGGRVVTPSHGAWERAGSAVAAIAKGEKRDLRTIPKSLMNDVLLAASCREAGITLITDNLADFRMIDKYLKHNHMAPWPMR
jgi:predicted nucleic acid-binding protein